MILDTLPHSARYESLHPAFARAFAVLATTDLAALTAGRHDLDGDRMFVIIDHKEDELPHSPALGKGRGHGTQPQPPPIPAYISAESESSGSGHGRSGQL